MDPNPFIPFTDWEQPEFITTGSDLIAHSSGAPAWHPSAQVVATNGMTNALISLENHLINNGLFVTLTTVGSLALGAALPPALFPPAFVNLFATQFVLPLVQDTPNVQAEIEQAAFPDQLTFPAFPFSPFCLLFKMCLLVKIRPSGSWTRKHYNYFEPNA